MTASVQQGFPQLSTPFVDTNRLLALPWYQLMIELWQKQGGGTSTASATIILQYNGVNVGMYDAVTGAFLGNVSISNPVGGAAVNVVPGASPFTYTAPQAGTLIVAAAQIEISRDSGANWFIASVTGGTVPVLFDDQVRMTWYGPNIPVITFLPTN